MFRKHEWLYIWICINRIKSTQTSIMQILLTDWFINRCFKPYPQYFSHWTTVQILTDRIYFYEIKKSRDYWEVRFLTKTDVPLSVYKKILITLQTTICNTSLIWNLIKIEDDDDLRRKMDVVLGLRECYIHLTIKPILFRFLYYIDFMSSYQNFRLSRAWIGKIQICSNLKLRSLFQKKSEWIDLPRHKKWFLRHFDSLAICR